ncbi:MAG: transcriptional regulator [Alphaproteobacteria bacterium 32-64-14]|nr:MAG: transcriptional regulator [Alphaproteobacteria bacterium 32-64-14]
MEGPDEIIHQSMRLRIAASLNALPSGELLEFGKLKSMLGATDGNMATHLGALEKAGYIAVEKDFVGKKPRTRVSLTRVGRKAFERHVSYLKDLLEGGQ